MNDGQRIDKATRKKTTIQTKKRHLSNERSFWGRGGAVAEEGWVGWWEGGG